jgi:DNA-binding response OmpR family regulator
MKGRPPVVAVVDDEAEVLRALRRLLRTEGFDVSVFSTGEEFIRQVRALAPDCVVLDLHMPRTTGFDVLDALDALPDGARPPVIVLTGNDTPAGRARAMGCGAHAYFCKPADAEILIQAINGAMSRHAGDTNPEPRGAERQ